MSAAPSKATFTYTTLTPEGPRARFDRVTCKNGHIQTPMVQVVNKGDKPGQVRRTCGICREAARERYYKKNRLRHYA